MATTNSSHHCMGKPPHTSRSGVYVSFLSVWAGLVTRFDPEKVVEMTFTLGLLSLGLKRTDSFCLPLRHQSLYKKSIYPETTMP